MDSADRIFFLLDQMRNLDQRQFGYLIGVSPDTVSNWRCHRSKSYTKYLPQIADVLNTTIEYIVSGDRSSPVVAPASREELQAAFWGGEKDLSQDGNFTQMEDGIYAEPHGKSESSGGVTRTAFYSREVAAVLEDPLKTRREKRMEKGDDLNG